MSSGKSRKQILKRNIAFYLISPKRICTDFPDENGVIFKFNFINSLLCGDIDRIVVETWIKNMNLI